MPMTLQASCDECDAYWETTANFTGPDVVPDGTPLDEGWTDDDELLCPECSADIPEVTA